MENFTIHDCRVALEYADIPSMADALKVLTEDEAYIESKWKKTRTD